MSRDRPLPDRIKEMTTGQTTRTAHRMASLQSYTRVGRFLLVALAIFGLVVVNGAFICSVFFHEDGLVEAMRNPIAFAFILEALVLTWAFAFLLRKWGVSRLHPVWFVVLSLIGSMAFALPVAFL